MPWERLINICITVILIPLLLPTLTICRVICPALELPAVVGDVRRRGSGAGQGLVSSGRLLSIRRFSDVQQFPRLTTISYPSICVSCHHNGLQGLMLWAVCQLFLGCRETPPQHGHEHMELCFVHADINLDVNINDMNILVSSSSSSSSSSRRSRCMVGPCMSPCYIPFTIPWYTLVCYIKPWYTSVYFILLHYKSIFIPCYMIPYLCNMLHDTL